MEVSRQEGRVREWEGVGRTGACFVLLGSQGYWQHSGEDSFIHRSMSPKLGCEHWVPGDDQAGPQPSPECSVPFTMLDDSLYVGYLATAGVMVDDLSGDGTVHVGEEHLGVAVRGHTAVHHHQGTLHSLSPPGVVLLQDSERG